MRKNRDTKEIFKKIGTLEKIFLTILVLPISIFVLFDLLIYYNILYYPIFNVMDPTNAISLLIIFYILFGYCLHLIQVNVVVEEITKPKTRKK
jgi:hypothetical protein